jgi:hypothetical protein
MKLPAIERLLTRALILLVVAGCGGGSNGGTAEDACHDWAQAFCERDQSCDPTSFQSSYRDQAACVLIEARACAADYGAPDVVDTPQMQRACGAALAKMSCNEFLNGAGSSACEAAPGRRKDGEPCTTPLQCHGLVCAYQGEAECGRCLTLANAGEVCSGDDDCASSVCTHGRCGAWVPEGKPCAGTAECSGYLVCREGKCAQAPGENGDCSLSGEICGPGLTCTEARVCQRDRLVDAGERCGSRPDGSMAVCRAGSECGSGAICEKQPRSGEACTVVGPRCADLDQSCLGGKCRRREPSRCSKGAGPSPGGPDFLGKECAPPCRGTWCASSGSAIDKTCAGSDLGSPCLGTSEGMYCSQSCASDSDCESPHQAMRCLTECPQYPEAAGKCWTDSSAAFMESEVCPGSTTTPPERDAGSPDSGVGVGPSARLQAAPPSLSFPATRTGGRSPEQLVAVTNVGGASSGTLVVRLGGNSEAFDIARNGCAGSLAPGARCTIVLAFQPVEIMPVSAVLSVEAPAGGRLTIPLFGRGLSVDAAPLPDAESDAGAAPADGPVLDLDASVGGADLAALAKSMTLATVAAGPQGFSLDGDHLYWTSGEGNVQRVSTLGGTVETVASAQKNPTQVVAHDGAIYWTNLVSTSFGPSEIWRASATGSNSTKLGMVENLASALAVEGDSVFVTTASLGGSFGSLWKVPIGGGPPALLSRQAASQVRETIAVDQHDIVWTSTPAFGNSDQVVRLARDASGPSTALVIYSASTATVGGLCLRDGMVHVGTKAGLLKIPATGGTPEIVEPMTFYRFLAAAADGVLYGATINALYRIAPGATPAGRLVGRAEGDVSGLAVDASAVYWAEYNYGSGPGFLRNILR